MNWLHIFIDHIVLQALLRYAVRVSLSLGQKRVPLKPPIFGLLLELQALADTPVAIISLPNAEAAVFSCLLSIL